MAVVRRIMTLCKFIFFQYELISSVVSLLGLQARAAIHDTEGKARCRSRGTFVYSGIPLIWMLVIWIGLALRVNLLRIVQN